jgi:pimeloyl-ACP methyl ester carboxylesterase
MFFMKNLKTYGKAPYNIAVVHGGPGAAGEMAPVARELASDAGILEPLQTATTLHGQVEELKNAIIKKGYPPVLLIGFSWGAWLSFILAANYPAIAKKLILIGSGPFEDRFAGGIQETRLSRLDNKEQLEFKYIIKNLDNPEAANKDNLLARLGELTSKTDEFDPATGHSDRSESINIRGDIFQNVWKDASEFRKRGELLKLGRLIECPVTAIHGDYDPHPAEGVKEPLSFMLANFRFILLKNCGHKPWVERQARDEFYEILREEIC